ncbi:hypothetical protein [Halorubellus sp. PRR65]|uniref:hypothetical protein n=1 Tax=Halorubellus sp. PRR65 TaxID=3098148 RepID=UPI002B25A51E|nr:hypothetical protein [Halorubellus sp. PRR65]
MRRRALLAALGSSAATSALAGCLDPAGSGPTTNGTDARDDPTESGTRTDVATSDGSVSTCEPSTPTFDVADVGTDGDHDEAPEDAEFVVRDVVTSTSYDRPETRFVLEPDAFYSEAAVERERENGDDEIVVEDISEIDDATVREAIRTAVETGAWRADELPNDLRETVERVDFVTGVSEGDTYTHVGVALHEFPVDDPPAIEFGAGVANRYVTPNSPGTVALWLANAREEELAVTSGAVPPFSMLRPVLADGDGGTGDGNSGGGSDERFILWRDYVEESDGCFGRRDGDWIRCDIGVQTGIQACDSVVREYEILPSTTGTYPDETVPPGPGRYEVSGSVGYSHAPHGPSVELEYVVAFTLERV